MARPSSIAGAAVLALLSTLNVGCDPKLSVHTINRFTPEPENPPLRVLSVDPPPASKETEPDRPVTIAFSQPVDPGSLGDRPVLVAAAGCGALVDGSAALDPGGTHLTFTPQHPLETPAVTYRIDLSPGLRTAAGEPLELSGAPLPSLFTTVDRDLSPLSFDGITRVETVSARSLRAGWNPARDASTPREKIVYRVYLSQAPDKVFTSRAAESAPDAGEVLVTGLERATRYFLAVRAVDGACREDRNEAVLDATTGNEPEPDVRPPDFAGARSAHPLSPHSLEVAWDTATDDRDAAADIRYRIYLATDPAALDFDAPPAAVVQGADSVQLSGLEQDRLHFAVVRAVDTSDNVEENRQVVSARTQVSFAEAVQPVLRAQCAVPSCHTPTAHKNGLDASTYAGLIRGGITRNPNTVVPGNSAGSLLIWRTDARNAKFQEMVDLFPGWPMPSGRDPLAPETLDVFIRWIDQGAVDN